MDMVSNDQQMLVEESLNLVAEKDVDLTPSVYRHLFSMSPDAADVFDGIPSSQQGLMLSKVLELIMSCAQGEEKIPEFRDYDIPLHDDLGVTPSMYRAYFEALILALKDVLGGEWSDSYENAWRLQFKKLIAEVTVHSASE
ncbi:MAG: globin [Porticoccaceae bacterium]